MPALTATWTQRIDDGKSPAPELTMTFAAELDGSGAVSTWGVRLIYSRYPDPVVSLLGLTTDDPAPPSTSIRTEPPWRALITCHAEPAHGRIVFGRRTSSPMDSRGR